MRGSTGATTGLAVAGDLDLAGVLTLDGTETVMACPSSSVVTKRRGRAFTAGQGGHDAEARGFLGVVDRAGGIGEFDRAAREGRDPRRGRRRRRAKAVAASSMVLSMGTSLTKKKLLQTIRYTSSLQRTMTSAHVCYRGKESKFSCL